MVNLPFAQQIQKTVELRIKELERALGIARAAGVNVVREVVELAPLEPGMNTRKRQRFVARA